MASWSPLVILAGLAILALLAYGIQRSARAKPRTVPVWYCGEDHAAAMVAYRASSFYRPFNHIFQNVYPSFAIPAPRFPVFLRRLLDLDRWLYLPAAHAVEKAADDVSRTHVGTPQIHLLWIVIGAISVTALMLVLLH